MASIHEQMFTLRQQGMTLAKIGHKFGLTREAIRQDLVRHYGTTEMPGMVCASKVAQQLGVAESILMRLCRAGTIPTPRDAGVHLKLYSSAEVVEVYAAFYNSRVCKHCGKPRPPRRRSYCADCAREHRRYYYPFLSAEEKERHQTHCYKWRKAHPASWLEISRRAGRKYREKRRREKQANVDTK